MTDQMHALQITNPASQPETLQEKLQKIKLVNPVSGQATTWKKSEYVKSLAFKAKQSLGLLSSDLS